MRRQPRFQTLAQGGVAQAGVLEEGVALVRRHFERGSQQHFFPILRRWHV